jgi:hypothetical protein
MADAPKPQNGNSHTTFIQAGVRLGSQVIHGLSPQFLALIIINALFIGVLFWFVDARARHSVAVIQQLLTSCLHPP